MSINEGDCIKHARMTDVALFVTEILKNANGMVITGRWVNLGQTKSYLIHLPRTTFHINKRKISEWSKWEDCNAVEAYCLRNLKWVSCL